MDKTKKRALIEDHKAHDKDTGSTEVQVAILTMRIKELTEHLKVHRHDHHTEHGLIKLVGQRRRLLAYLEREDRDRYVKVTKRLGLRK
ncbi:MAG: 30S ribosomal protein S15 [Chloroflexota bacterium]|nr:30S ribosomal protein S15 [Chloroflexota bacterium]